MQGMSYRPGPDDVRCGNGACGEWYHKALRSCPMCDAPNTPRSTPATPPAYVAPPAPMPQQPPPGFVAVPSQHLNTIEELTEQYKTLIRWQIFGFIFILDGPVLLLALAISGLFVPVLTASILFPVAASLLPTAALIGLIHAVFRKPAIRQKLAEMGVNASEWVRPLEAPLRAFWIFTAAFTGAIVMVSTLLYVFKGGRGEEQEIDQRTSPTLYEYDYQKRGVQ